MPDPNDPNFRLSNEFSEGPQMDLVGPFKPPDNGGINGAVGALTNYISGTVQRAEQAKLQAQTEMKTEVTPQYPGGRTTFSGPSELMNRFAAQIKKADSIDQNYERMIMEKQARIDQQKPWANALATIAGSLAANDPNPITRGLGQAAQQLNPTRAQLQAQQMQLLQGQAQAAGQGLQAAEGMYKLQNDMSRPKFELEQQKARETKINRFMESMRRSASGGRAVPIDAFVAGAMAEGFNQNEALSFYQLHKGQAEAYSGGRIDREQREVANKKTFADYMVDINNKRDANKGAISRSNRIAGIREAFRLGTSDNKADYETKLYQAKKQIDLSVADDKDFVKLGSDRGALVETVKTELILDTMKEIFADPRAAAAAPPISRNPKTGEWDFNPEAWLPASFQGEERRKYVAFLEHEKPRIISLIKGGKGAGGISLASQPAGQELLKNMGASKDLRADQILAVEQVVRDSNNGIRLAVMKGRDPKLFATGKYDGLLGRDNPNNDYFWKKGQDAFGKPIHATLPSAGQQPAAPVASEPTATGPNGEKMVFRGGKWQPLK